MIFEWFLACMLDHNELQPSNKYRQIDGCVFDTFNGELCRRLINI